ncbi:MAG: hypothetical protein WCW44_02970 [archaeon]|jgi:hypothetical protein
MENKEVFMGLGIAGTGVLLGLAILVVIIGISFLTGSNGILHICEDQSREKLSACNIDCGEGIMSSLCKTNCTAEHNNRLELCAAK